MDLISVIIPVYKVEKYLDRCVESIVNQTYNNLEIILVDDGSPDSCGEICDMWSEKDARIKVIHKPNGGLSDARNVGVIHSTGDYITFVDSDDYISVDMISYLYELIIRYNADVSCCNLRRSYSFSESFCNQPEESVEVFDNVESILALFGNFYIQLVTACGSLYKSELVKNNPFPVGRLHEDEAITYKYYYESNKVVISNLELYAYFQNEGSITHNKTEKNIIDTLLAFEERALYFYNRGKLNLGNLAYSRYVQYMINYASNGDKYSIKKLKEISLLGYLRSESRMANKLNYICWLLFRKNFYKIYCQCLNKIKKKLLSCKIGKLLVGR